MACLQRKQHLDFLEIHAAGDVLVNKPQLFTLGLFCKELFIRLLYCLFYHMFSSPTLEGAEIRVSSLRFPFLLQNVSHFTLNRLCAHSSNSDVRYCRSLSQERVNVSRLFTACRTALMSIICCTFHPLDSATVTSQATGCSWHCYLDQFQPGFVSYQGESLVYLQGRKPGWDCGLAGLGLDLSDLEHR